MFGAAAAAAAQRSVDNEEEAKLGMRSLKRECWNVEREREAKVDGVRACGKFLISFSSSFTPNTANFQFAAQMRDGKLELDGGSWCT